MAATPTCLISASGSSSLRIYSTRSSDFPLLQSLDGAHKLGCHHVATSANGKKAASIGFGGEVKIWANDSFDGTDIWTEDGKIVGADLELRAQDVLGRRITVVLTKSNGRWQQSRRTMGHSSFRRRALPREHDLRRPHKRLGSRRRQAEDQGVRNKRQFRNVHRHGTILVTTQHTPPTLQSSTKFKAKPSTDHIPPTASPATANSQPQATPPAPSTSSATPPAACGTPSPVCSSPSARSASRPARASLPPPATPASSGCTTPTRGNRSRT